MDNTELRKTIDGTISAITASINDFCASVIEFAGSLSFFMNVTSKYSLEAMPNNWRKMHGYPMIRSANSRTHKRRYK